MGMISASKIRVMIVDDEAVMRTLVRRSLQHIGITQLFEAKDGFEAMIKVRTNRIHIIISDYSMPVMNGLEFLEMVRNDAELTKVGFIMLSGVSEGSIVRKAEALGVNGFIIKPFSLIDLQARMDNLFHKLNGSRIEWKSAA